MSNVNKLLNSKNKSLNIFASAITMLAQSQGFYGRLCSDINEMEQESFDRLKTELKKQKFVDTLNVVMWLEC